MMTITQNKVVSVNYHLSASKNNEAEQLVEQTSKDHPFVFLFGVGQLIPDFEMNLLNKKVGDTFDFKIAAAKGYGLVEQDMIVKINKEAFYVDGKFDDTRVRVGEELAMNDADGNQLMGTVAEVGFSHVTMDFNHPLAGHDLHFSGEVLDVREATADELAHGHVHGPHGHHH
ncbi:MAG: FKBP-type peptidyl-prolyl cis-trans isomerase [Bacteroidetes bacterium]|nr:FKBP-type peptidyl-prolyl cis-trans isomerase [Bacteroidota bacterium]